ncbi:MAG: PAS domain S-box protein [Gammaproteobacteria bacterium]|jgi:two-component system sensor kinase FixL|nr:PAS domain S-box protein [Gammaproteobacteria bacterium]NCF81238.1 PAS domain S-box protein [Pseudomonadota bacterium]
MDRERTSNDSAELERTRQLLDDREARLNAILDTAVDGIITIDERGIIESVNRGTERIFGYTSDELVGRSVKLLMPSPYREEHDGYMARYLQTGQPRIIGIGREAEGQHKDGTRFPIDLAVSEIRVPGARVFTGMVRDISARRRAEAEARRRNAELAHAARLSTIGELTSGIAHEVNQPLTAMVNFAEACLRMLRSGNADTHKLEDALGQITVQGQRAGHIIRHMRRLARKGESERVTVNVSHLVQDVLGLVSNELRASGIALHLVLDESLPAVKCDRIQVEQVVLNLVRNAMDVLEEGPAEGRELTIRTRADGHENIEILVEDAGEGFAVGDDERIFETFFTTKPDGLGMGLSISRSIIEDHGGRLWASPRPGGGAIFHVNLPAGDGEIA